MPAEGKAKRAEPDEILTFRDELRPGFKRAQWYVQRAIWALLLVVVVLALVGLFGQGAISDGHTSASSDGVNVELQYPRFSRLKQPQELNIEVTAEGAEELTLTIPSAFMDKIRIESIEPEPDSVSISGNGASYTWPTEGGDGALAITIEYLPLAWRKVDGEVGVIAGGAEAQTLDFTQYIFP